MTSLSFILLLLASPAAPQTSGGDATLLHHLDGTAPNEYFGYSTSITGDVNGDGFDDFIVGAYGVSLGILQNVGAAYAYSGVDGSLLYQWSGTDEDDHFGISVAGAGDVNGDGFDDLIVGSSGANPAGRTSAGSAFVYSGADGSLLYRWNGLNVRDNFGFSVAAAGDTNADGFDDVIVGAFRSDSNGLWDRGAAYVLSGIDGSILHLWEGDAISDYFGYSVSGAGDVNGDGFDDLIVGANLADPGGRNKAGIASVFSGADGTMLYQWEGEASYDEFGESVSGAGDFDGDGLADLIVGAQWTAQWTGLWAGSAYVYSGATGSLIVRLDGENSFDNFGDEVASAGDVNGDGFDDVLVGSYEATIHGSAYVYSGADHSLLFKKSGEASWDSFGSSVSGGGDLNGDGLADFIVGADNTDHAGLSRSGSIYVYSFEPFLLTNTSSISAASGGTLVLNLKFPAAAAFDEYKILMSASGTGPTRVGIDIPLTTDSLAINTFLGNYPVPATNMHGTLDSSGMATGSLAIPAGLPAALIGERFFLAAIANQPGQLPEYSSTAVTITITN